MSGKSKKGLSKKQISIIISIAVVIGLILFRLFAPDTFNSIFLGEETGAADTVSTQASPAASSPSSTTASSSSDVPAEDRTDITEAGELALYLHVYGHLPSNFITKDKARELGWTGGGLDPYIKGGCIGGDSFSNAEGLLPKASGRKYYECDVGTLGADQRGARRLVYSNDGLIFYTEDHYASYTQLY